MYFSSMTPHFSNKNDQISARKMISHTWFNKMCNYISFKIEFLVWPSMLGGGGLGRSGLVALVWAAPDQCLVKNVFCRVSGSGTTETGANPRNMSGCIMCPTTAPRG